MKRRPGSYTGMVLSLSAIAVLFAFFGVEMALAQKGGKAPSAPTGLVAVGGSSQVTLTWNPSSGATSYDVKRSLRSGRGYSTIASVPSPAYVDATVQNNITYYYVVTAVNSSGESGKSNEASATPRGAPPWDATVVFSDDGYCTLARADGTGQTRIGSLRLAADNSSADDSCYAWAPGGPIFFETVNGVAKINPDGSGEQLIVSNTSSDGVSVTRHSLTPDGNRRVFYIKRGSTAFQLCAARLDGTDEIAMDYEYSVFDPSVSPSGDKVALANGLLIVVALGLVNGRLAITGGELLFNDPSHPLYDWWIENPQFEDVSLDNPNGTKIVFEAFQPFGPTSIFRVDLTSPEEVELLVPDSVVPGHPHIDPSGQYLFYDGLNVSGQRTIWRANRNGTGAIDWSHASATKHTRPTTKP